MRDRTPPGPVSIFMSGGRDSTAIAAIARREVPSADLRSFTAYHERLIPDQVSGSTGSPGAMPAIPGSSPAEGPRLPCCGPAMEAQRGCHSPRVLSNDAMVLLEHPR